MFEAPKMCWMLPKTGDFCDTDLIFKSLALREAFQKEEDKLGHLSQPPLTPPSPQNLGPLIRCNFCSVLDWATCSNSCINKWVYKFVWTTIFRIKLVIAGVLMILWFDYHPGLHTLQKLFPLPSWLSTICNFYFVPSSTCTIWHHVHNLVSDNQSVTVFLSVLLLW